MDTTNPTDCGPLTGPPSSVPWTPGYARFRDFVGSSGGGSTTNFKVYVSQCDAGNVAIIDTFADEHDRLHILPTCSHAIADGAAECVSVVQTSISAAAERPAHTSLLTPTRCHDSGLQVGMKMFVTGMVR